MIETVLPFASAPIFVPFAELRTFAPLGALTVAVASDGAVFESVAGMIPGVSGIGMGGTGMLAAGEPGWTARR
jgi:hypothetical protein